MTGLRRHRTLLLFLVALQASTVTLPLLAWLRYAPDIGGSWLARVTDNFGGLLLIVWTWMGAITLIGVGAYWDAEMNQAFYLEAWRYRSFASWVRQRLVCASMFGAVVLGIGLLPFLAYAYRGEPRNAVAVVALLALYTACLSLAIVVAHMLGARTEHAFAAVLLFHATNIVFDGIAWPNVVSYFLIGERASAVSALVASVVIAVTVAWTSRCANPTTISVRGSEHQ